MPIHLWSRRTFLRNVTTAGIAAAVPKRLIGNENPQPRTWALISDTHINAKPQTTANLGQNMTDNLRAVLEDVADRIPKPAGIMINGDLAHMVGQAGDYAQTLKLLEPVRQAKTNLHLVLGNHDHRQRFWAAMDDSDRAEAVNNKHVSVVDDGRIRWVFLDSLIKTNHTPGQLGKAQLAWLSKTLDADTETPTLIFLHHNLANTSSALQDTDTLLALLKPRRQVKAVFYGHTHVYGFKQVDGIHLVNLPACGYPFSPTQPVGWVRAAVDATGIDIELRALNANTDRHGEKRRLDWRNA